MAITEADYEKLIVTVNGIGWREVVKPRMALFANQAIQALCNPADKRTGVFEGFSDDMLRGCIVACEYVLKTFEEEVKVHRMNRLHEQANGTEAGSN